MSRRKNNRDKLLEISKGIPCQVDGVCIDENEIADYLSQMGLELVVHCVDCEYLGIKDFVYGYCKKNMCGIINPNDYCSQGKIHNKKRKQTNPIK